MNQLALNVLNFILWDTSPEIFHHPDGTSGPMGFLHNIRWYGLLFATGFIVGQQLMTRFFAAEGKPARDVDTLTFYMVIGTVLGARLGHCFFYEPAYFLKHPLEILMVWQGGLASHGATVGILLAVWLYSRNRPGQSYLWTLDRVVITVALAGALIRTGNLINAEIVGKPTDAPWAFSFVGPGRLALEQQIQGLKSATVTSLGRDTVANGMQLTAVRYNLNFDATTTPEPLLRQRLLTDVPQVLQRSNYDEVNLVLAQDPAIQISQAGGDITGSIMVWAVPRHPAQIYEALSCLVVFVLFLVLWNRKKAALPEGQLFGLFLVIVFGLRIVYETLKENQVDFEDNLALNMGQVLSIPLVLAGLYLSIWGLPKRFRA